MCVKFQSRHSPIIKSNKVRDIYRDNKNVLTVEKKRRKTFCNPPMGVFVLAAECVTINNYLPHPPSTHTPNIFSYFLLSLVLVQIKSLMGSIGVTVEYVLPKHLRGLS